MSTDDLYGMLYEAAAAEEFRLDEPTAEEKAKNRRDFEDMMLRKTGRHGRPIAMTDPIPGITNPIAPPDPPPPTADDLRLARLKYDPLLLDRIEKLEHQIRAMDLLIREISLRLDRIEELERRVKGMEPWVREVSSWLGLG